MAPKWQPAETAPEYVTVLAQHEDDLFPVPAFRMGEHWLRCTEGPEDVEFPESGRHGFLYRNPTHWQPLPESPLVEAERLALMREAN